MSIVSGTIAALAGADATKQASQNSANAQNRATEIANQNYQQQRADFEPFRKVGVDVIPTYQSMLNGNYDMNQSPAARYQMTAGTKAMNRALAARGMSGGGTAINRLTELSQNVAASDWKDQYSRILDALKLGTGASSSMGAASNVNTQANQAAAQNLGNIYQQAGNNQASLYAGLGGQSLNAAALGIKGYQAFKPSTASNTGYDNGEGAEWLKQLGTEAV